MEPGLFDSKGKIFVKYQVNPLAGGGKVRWRVFPISWLYEP